MTIFLASPRLLKGAIVGVDPLNPLASVVVFQYNPDTMTRRLEPRAVSSEGDCGESFCLTGPPKEAITLSVEIAAADQLEQANYLAASPADAGRRNRSKQGYHRRPNSLLSKSPPQRKD